MNELRHDDGLYHLRALGLGQIDASQRADAAVPKLRFSVSYTTRYPRGEERDGEDYFFISREDSRSASRAGEFLEYAEVFGNYYGTHISELERAAGRATTWCSTSTCRVRDN